MNFFEVLLVVTVLFVPMGMLIGWLVRPFWLAVALSTVIGGGLMYLITLDWVVPPG